MLLIDDILLAPLRGLLLVFREVHDAAQQELAGEQEAIRAELYQAYMMLETGQITPGQFEAREEELLERLEQLESFGPDADGELQEIE